MTWSNISNTRRWWVALGLVCASAAAWAGLPVERWVHESGAQVNWVYAPHLPMLDVQIDMDAGSRRDPPEQAGLATATALLWSKGVAAVAQRPALDENDLTQAWADLGTTFTATAQADRMSFRLRTLTDPAVLTETVVLARHMLQAPAFAEPVWTRERQRWIADWREAQNQPGTWAQRLFAQAVYGPHPYGQEASHETLTRIDVADIRAFYQRHVRACDARLTLVGALNRAQVQTWVNELLQAWPHGTCQVPPTMPDVQTLGQAQHINHPFAGAAQAHVWVGQPGIARKDPDYFAVLVGNHILGGSGFSSRLMQEIREKRGLTYGVYSSFSPGKQAGAFAVGLQTRPDQAPLAVQLIQETLQRFVAEGPTPTEMAQAQAALINSFALRLDSNAKWLDNVANMAWHDLPVDYLDTWTQQVRRVSREDVRRAFQRVLQPQRMVTVVVGAHP